MDTSSIEKNGKIFLLAYDQGLEHGPTDFNELNYHPNHILKIGLEGNASCVAMHYGHAKHFYLPEMRKTLPLILKLNGKTNLYSGNYLSAVDADIEDALNLGAVGIGFTIFPGQKDEHIQFEQFAKLRKEAEKAGLITILWSYGRGPEIKNNADPKIVAYSARVAAELGADVVKVKYPGNVNDMKWAVDCAAGTKLIASGTENFSENYIDEVKQLVNNGVSGIAVGRKIWQDENPVELATKVAAAIYGE